MAIDDDEVEGEGEGESADIAALADEPNSKMEDLD